MAPDRDDDGDEDYGGETIGEHRQNDRTVIALLRADMRFVKHNMVTKHEFWPVKVIVYSLAGSVFSAVLVAILALVIRK